MTKLVAIFKTSLGRSQTLSFDNPDQTKATTEVKSLLDRFTKLKLFHKNGDDLYVTVESAKYVKTTETIIF